MKVIIALAIIGFTAVSAAVPVCPANPSGEENARLPNPDDCTTYYSCQGTYPILTPCPHGLHFNPKTLSCQDPEKAGCASNPEVPEEPAKPPVYPVTCPPQSSQDDDVMLANPKDCKSFYHCSNGFPHLQYCPPGLHFNDKLKICDWPANAKCVVESLY